MEQKQKDLEEKQMQLEELERRLGMFFNLREKAQNTFFLILLVLVINI